MAAISSTISSPFVTDWSSADRILVKCIKYPSPQNNGNGQGEISTAEISIQSGDSIAQFRSRTFSVFGDWGNMSYIFIRNYGYLDSSQPSLPLNQKKIILQKDSDVYLIMTYNNNPSLFPIDEDLKIQMQQLDKYSDRFSKNYFYIDTSEIQLCIRNIFNLMQNNNVSYRKRMLEGFSSSQISLQFPESDMRIIKKSLSEVLDVSDLRMIPKTVQNIIHSYLDHFPKLSLNEPTNFSKLIFKAMELRSLCETRDEEEVITYFNKQYVSHIKPYIDKIVEARESHNIEHLKELSLEFVKVGLSLIKTDKIDPLIQLENTGNYTPEIETENTRNTENVYAEELYSLLTNPNKTIFEALNTLIRKFVILRQSNDNQQFTFIIGEKNKLPKKINIQLSPYISTRQLYLLMTEKKEELGISDSDSRHFRILRGNKTCDGKPRLWVVFKPNGQIIKDILYDSETKLWWRGFMESNHQTRLAMSIPLSTNNGTVLWHDKDNDISCYENEFLYYQSSDFSSWTDDLPHATDGFSVRNPSIDSLLT